MTKILKDFKLNLIFYFIDIAKKNRERHNNFPAYLPKTKMLGR